MKLTLPARSNAAPLTIDSRCFIVIGANGSGKTRFGRALTKSLGRRAFTLAAVDGLYNTRGEDTAPGSIDSQYHAAVESSALIRNDIENRLERIIAILINEAVSDLVSAQLASEDAGRQGRSRLRKLIDAWQQIFPDNKIFINCGRMLFNRPSESDQYSAGHLSSGERAVMYYLGGALLAPKSAVVLVYAPEMFMHPSIIRPLWDTIERMRPDCTFIYITHDLGFASARGNEAATIWVKSCDPEHNTWDYDMLPVADGMPDEVYLAILGERKPVLFIEGDNRHSYDAKFYPLIFTEYTVKPLGSCDRVIEATRSFNALQGFHNLDAWGIVDRDRRDRQEVAYLRTRRILVPEVAEIENIFMVEDVVKAVAARNSRNPDKAFAAVRRNLLSLFKANIEKQALEHTRHRLKRDVAHRVDGHFDNIAQVKQHFLELMNEINPESLYESLVKQFKGYAEGGDYASVLRVFNYKSMLIETHVASLCGFHSDDRKRYTATILNMLRDNEPGAAAIRAAVRRVFNL